MNNYDRNKSLIFLCLSIIFLILVILDSEILIISISRSIIGLFLAIYILGDEVRHWVFRASTSKMDRYESFALNIAFSISFLIFLGAVLSFFHLFTGFLLSLCLAALITISLLFRLFLEYSNKTKSSELS